MIVVGLSVHLIYGTSLICVVALLPLQRTSQGGQSAELFPLNEANFLSPFTNETRRNGALTHICQPFYL